MFKRLHIRFIEAPIAAAMNVFATTPPVKVVSRNENAFPITFIRVVFGTCGGISDDIVKLARNILSNDGSNLLEMPLKY